MWPFAPATHAEFLSGEQWSASDVYAIRHLKGLDSDILAWAPSVLSSDKWTKIEPCLDDFTSDPNEKIECVLDWLARSLNVSDSNSLFYLVVMDGVLGSLTPSSTFFKENIDGELVRWYRRLLLDAMESIEPAQMQLAPLTMRRLRQERAGEEEPTASTTEAFAVMALRYLMLSEPEPTRKDQARYMNMLLKIRECLPVPHPRAPPYASRYYRIISSALFECCLCWEYPFDEPGTPNVICV